jgi:archaemetzincin
MFSPEKKMIISPVGVLDDALIEYIKSKIISVFGYQVEVIPLLQDMGFAFDRQRGQYHSTQILKKLAGHAPSLTLKVLAVTNVDLFIPILTHVYGEAQLGGTACIISTFRLDEDLTTLSGKKALYLRAGKEALHEMGHTFRLRHCKDPNCLMHYCHTLKDVDRKTDQFCRYCTVLLQDEKKRMMKSLRPRK